MTHGLTHLTALAARPTRLVAGAMSGTSMDAIDVALCDITADAGETRVGLRHFHTSPYPPGLRERLRDPAALTARDVAELHVALGEAFADACLQAFQSAGLDGVGEVALIGSHGQTVYHHSRRPGAARATLQLGDADVIAARTGLPVVADFRARDIAEGGEGAPLTPFADVTLYALRQHPGRAVLNLGGLANLTAVDRDGHVFGFDTGPANAPLDRLSHLLSGGRLSCDEDGALARAGRVIPALLAALQQDPYFAAPPPKSTGFESYGDAFVADLTARFGPPTRDTLATVTHWVAWSVGDALRRHVSPRADVTEIILAGGGGRNPELRRHLAAAVAPTLLTDSAAVGVPPQAREAMAFALLADAALRGEPASLPAVTGARRPAVLGKWSLP